MRNFKPYSRDTAMKSVHKSSEQYLMIHISGMQYHGENISSEHEQAPSAQFGGPSVLVIDRKSNVSRVQVGCYCLYYAMMQLLWAEVRNCAGQLSTWSSHVLAKHSMTQKAATSREGAPGARSSTLHMHGRICTSVQRTVSIRVSVDLTGELQRGWLLRAAKGSRMVGRVWGCLPKD